MRFVAVIMISILASLFLEHTVYSETRHLLSECLSVCLFVRHTRDSRLNGSGYQIRFAPYDIGIMG